MKITVSGVDALCNSLIKYNAEKTIKVKLLLERLATIGAYRARVEFTNAMYAGDNDVAVSVEPITNGYRVVAKGKAVIFIEFGTGVLNPEHPQSAEFGFKHGTYGKGKGANEKGWVYVGEQGNAGRPLREGVYRTYGNPPAKAMYQSSKEMRNAIYDIVKEVFG